MSDFFKRIPVALMALAAVAVLSVALPATASAGPLKIGVLTCEVFPGQGFVLYSSKDLQCRFAPTLRRRKERYDGYINKYGVDIGHTDRASIIWVVFALSGHPKHGALEGHYFGASAEATVGLGLGAHALLGGWRRSIMLQPISVQGQTGANIAAGLSTLNLFVH